MLLSGLCILFANRVDCSGMKTKEQRRPGGFIAKVKACGPFSVPFQRMLLHIVTIIPNVIDAFRHAIKRGGMFVFNTVFVGQNHESNIQFNH